MECRKCGKNFENYELTNGFCKDCIIKIGNKEDRKSKLKTRIKEISQTVIISSIISIILSVLIVAWLIIKVNGTNISLKSFTISDLSIIEDKSSYSTSYTGTAIIYCTDTSNDYLVEVAVTLISGGNSEDIGNTDYRIVVMHNGIAELNTYDYGSSGTISSPKYQIEVVGFRNFNV